MDRDKFIKKWNKYIADVYDGGIRLKLSGISAREFNRLMDDLSKPPVKHS